MLTAIVLVNAEIDKIPEVAQALADLDLSLIHISEPTRPY